MLSYQSLCVFSGILHAVLGQLSDGKSNSPSNPNQNYANNAYGSAQGSSIVGDGSPNHIMCYTCHFHVQKGHAQGMENCRDPFLKSGIPEVACHGPCGVSILWISLLLYLIRIYVCTKAIDFMY